ncbi:MAG TPA: hypothetical protein VKU19_06765 [Bryobacteraceae bacterium]|nr:hypothetical protein [Bryobacteraceae bacterium]
MPKRRDPSGWKLKAGLSEYREDLAAQRTAGEVELKHAELLRLTPERYREWIVRVAAASEETGVPLQRRHWLKGFLLRVQRSLQKPHGGLLSAVMSFVDAPDYEKHPWEDDSICLEAAQEYCDEDVPSLILQALASGDEYARRLAAKWLPRYVAGSFAAELLATLLGDSDRRVAWWAAVHLSRLEPKAPGLRETLVEALIGEWIPSARLVFQHGLRGAGEAAAALAQLGAEARSAVPALIEVGAPEWSPYDYDGLWAARAIWRIASNREVLDGLLASVSDAAAVASRIEEIGRTQKGLLCFVDWSVVVRVGK